MGILQLLALIGAIVLFFMVLFNAPVSQKLINAIFLFLLILLLAGGIDWGGLHLTR